MINKTKWLIDQAHSAISFKVRHLMIANVKGKFKTFDANINTIDKDFTAVEIDLWIDPSSIDTGDAKRDEHLKSVDFFDVQNHKQITFTSSLIEKSYTDGYYELWGKLTMKGITQKVKLNVQFGGILKDSFGNEKAGFTITGKINRTDWGLVWNAPIESGGLMVSDEVVISSEIELTKVDQKELKMELESSENYSC
jgi:polyisoprenoid-binding protein YceI